MPSRSEATTSLEFPNRVGQAVERDVGSKAEQADLGGKDDVRRERHVSGKLRDGERENENE
jgi:hypothetical protein